MTDRTNYIGLEKEKLAHLSLPFAIFAASFAAIFIRFSNVHPIAVAFYRMLFSSLILLFFIPSYIEEIKDLSRKEWIVIITTGFFLAVHFAAWISSLGYTTVASSVILVSAHPLIVSWIGGWYLKERAPKKIYVGIGIALIGLILMVYSDHSISEWALFGDILAILGMLAMAGYILRGRKVRQDMSLITYAFLVYLTSTIFLGFFSLGFSTFFTIYPPREYIIFLALAIIPTMFGHTVYNWALKYVRARLVSISLLGEPIGSSLLAFMLLHEIPPRLSILGGVITLFGIYLCTKYS
ncbi:MAG: DMT family transporter [Candidatus Natronoplasma sp.]